jgi:hypothetical protein
LRSPGNISRANILLREAKRITASEVADMLDVSCGSAYVTFVPISLFLWLVQELQLLFQLRIISMKQKT